jgi:hypothetical protein
MVSIFFIKLKIILQYCNLLHMMTLIENLYDKCHNTVVIVVQLILVTDLLIFGYVQSLNNME